MQDLYADIGPGASQSLSTELSNDIPSSSLPGLQPNPDAFTPGAAPAGHSTAAPGSTDPTQSGSTPAQGASPAGAAAAEHDEMDPPSGAAGPSGTQANGVEVAQNSGGHAAAASTDGGAPMDEAGGAQADAGPSSAPAAAAGAPQAGASAGASSEGTEGARGADAAPAQGAEGEAGGSGRAGEAAAELASVAGALGMPGTAAPGAVLARVKESAAEAEALRVALLAERRTAVGLHVRVRLCAAGGTSATTLTTCHADAGLVQGACMLRRPGAKVRSEHDCMDATVVGHTSRSGAATKHTLTPAMLSRRASL